MADIEKGQAQQASAPRPAKKEAKKNHSWSKIPLIAAILIMILIIVVFSSCKFLPNFVSQHCRADPVYYD